MTQGYHPPEREPTADELMGIAADRIAELEAERDGLREINSRLRDRLSRSVAENEALRARLTGGAR